MPRSRLFPAAVAVLVVTLSVDDRTVSAQEIVALDSKVKPVTEVKTPESHPTNMGEFTGTVKPFLVKYCTGCHGEKTQEADFSLHDINFRISDGKDLERWEKALELMGLGDMPPKEKDVQQPRRSEKRQIINWIITELKKVGRGPDLGALAMPSQGNRVNHEDLFSGKHKGPSYTPARLWRKSPKIYQTLKYGTQPFIGIGGTGFQDYATLIADEAPVNAMLRNSYLLADQMLKGEGHRNPIQAMLKYKDGELPAEDEKAMIDRVFHLVFGRSPDKEDAKYIEQLYEKNKALGGWRTGLRSLMVGMLLSPEFVFRMEIGLGDKLEDGRRMLSPKEIAYALSFALFDRPNQQLISLAQNGKLSTKSDVEREVRKILYVKLNKRIFGYGMSHIRYSPDSYPNPRLLRFFQEFFGYLPALDVFKEKNRFRGHYARDLVKDADFLILTILDNDKDVIKELLSTNHFVTRYFDESRIAGWLKQDRNSKQFRSMLRQFPGFVEILNSGKYPALGTSFVVRESYLSRPELETMNRLPGGYVTLPRNQRAGMLTHPAWLVAHSYNTENNLPSRGRWIREHLLAGLIPEIPIGVEAKVPDEPHKTLREKFSIVHEAACWRCHKKMNPLGYALEEFDDFGRYRTEILIGDVEGYIAKRNAYVDKRNAILKQLHHWESKDPKGIEFEIADAKKQLARKTPDKSDMNYEKQLIQHEQHIKNWTKNLESLKSFSQEKRNQELKRLQAELKELAKLKPIPETKPVDASGVLVGTGDDKLDGEFKNARDLFDRLAKSDRVHQSVIRHAFRYWMGRNETLNDSPTLMAAERAYHEHNGSFKEMVVSLLTSDSFLYRK